MLFDVGVFGVWVDDVVVGVLFEDVGGLVVGL